MKAAPFAYTRPGTVEEVVADLAREDAKVIAGGQSLVPVLAMRLGRPALLVDVNAVPELDALTRDGDVVRVGATVRQRRTERSELAAAVPLLRMALPWVGHREIRSRGTVCGSIAHADPSAELPAVARCLGATMVLTSTHGTREVPAADFFSGAMTTAVAADELLTQVAFPVARRDEGFGFGEFARRHGDFALAGVAVRVRAPGHGDGPEARVTCFGVSDVPVTADVSAELRAGLEAVGPAPSRGELVSALAGHAGDVARAVVDTGGDSHASPEYRRRLLSGLIAREVAAAYLRATRPETERSPR
ncbi:xanthine dehydrogenase family protein subunit M [Nocardioides sp. CFH 31398]|uniref:FAD binding domain-containing protein n=1 Tax=Nocardioides sp. CFH 31398 TaxID=2919579 RepID=UPI001F06FFB4|nr:FAD binding domain-containing protein [Nocardioides sp. CFH 31398]MCH1865552.1 FAD binding domain-containing protein [Nocardioides sp. CFH 31398]